MGLIVKDILNLGKKRLEEAGITESKTDSEILFCYMTGIERSKLFMEWSVEVGDKSFEQYFQLLDRRGSGVPLQYITGHQDFMGFDFKVNENVLIPRQDTEVVVSKAIEVIEEAPKKIKDVLDLCTGSGAIAVSMAKLVKGISVTASDVSGEALEVAGENAKANGAKIDFVQGDLLEPFEKRFRNKKFDMIISNPPYIETEVIDTLATEVKDHEPLLALDGGTDGLGFYRRIIDSAANHLTKRGVLVFEIGCDQGEAVKTLAQNAYIYEEAEIVKDLAGLDRVAVIRKKYN